MMLGMLPRFTHVVSGELAGTATLLQMPSIEARMVYLRAASDNAASVWVGGAGVTKPDGTLDATTGLELAKGDPPLVLYIDNLSRLWYISAVGDDLTFLVLR